MRKMKRIISLWLAVILVITGVDLPFGILEIQAAANVKRNSVLVLDTSDTAEFTYNKRRFTLQIRHYLMSRVLPGNLSGISVQRAEIIIWRSFLIKIMQLLYLVFQKNTAR